jgi:hypothetical protein
MVIGRYVDGIRGGRSMVARILLDGCNVIGRWCQGGRVMVSGRQVIGIREVCRRYRGGRSIV